MPRVSVVIPSYNHSSYLREAIEGVQAQTYSDWELVIVDDCSTDDSVSVVEAISDPRIRFVRNERNLGTYPTLNRCLDHSQGTYVAVLDSDDAWAPGKLESQIQALDRCPEASFSYTFGTATDENLVPKGDDHHQALPSASVQQPVASLLVENRILASSVVFRRGAVSFDPDLRHSGDWVALLRLCKRGVAAYVEEPLTFWRHHPSNTSRDLAAGFGEEIRIRRSILSDPEQWYLPGADREAVRKGLSLCAVRLHRLLVFGGDVAAARRALRLAVEIDPESRFARKRQLGHLLPRLAMVRLLRPGVPLERYREEYRAMSAEPVDLG